MFATDNVDDIASTTGWNTFGGKVLMDDPNATDGVMTECSSERRYVFDQRHWQVQPNFDVEPVPARLRTSRSSRATVRPCGR
jgi:hypothetical protein